MQATAYKWAFKKKTKETQQRKHVRQEMENNGYNFDNIKLKRYRMRYVVYLVYVWDDLECVLKRLF